MQTSDLYETYENILAKLSKTNLFGKCAVMHYLTISELKKTIVGVFYQKHALELKKQICSNNYINVDKTEHPNICGGVTEYLTKIKLAKELKIDLTELKFFDDINKAKYKNMSNEDIAFHLYEPDVVYRSTRGYTDEIKNHKDLIINKARILSDRALKLIHFEFPVITSIDFHPKGHACYKGKAAILGDCDLLINNCLIDFKNKKDPNIPLMDKAQLFAYSINKYTRDKKEYDKVYILNPRHNYICELIRGN